MTEGRGDAPDTEFPELALAGGGTARITDTDGATVVLSATLPSPPGSTLSGTTGAGRPFNVKVRGCRRESTATGAQSERFRIEGRFIDLTREQRTLLVLSFPRVSGG